MAKPQAIHDGIVELFKNNPSLAVELLRPILGVTLPKFDQISDASNTFSSVKSVGYSADHVLRLSLGDKDVLGVVVEVQRKRKERKRQSWPAYVAGLWQRLEIPVVLLVVSDSAEVARWAFQTPCYTST